MFSLVRIRLATTRSSRSVPLPDGAWPGFAVCPASTTVIVIIAPIVNAARKWFFIRIHPLLEKVLHFRDACSRARVIHFQIRSGTSNRADRVVADLDRHAAAQRENVCEIALCFAAGILRRAFLEIHRRDAEHAGGVGLAPRHVGGLSRRLLVAENDEHLSSAIDNRNRRMETLRPAFRLGGFRNRLRK